jgi:hypothetical protein
MTILSTGVLSHSPVTNGRLFQPFFVQARMVQSNTYPMAGNRWERIRAQEKVANLVELDLRDLVENGEFPSAGDDFGFFFSFPVALTPRFGNEPDRLSFSGYIEGSRIPLSQNTDGSFNYQPPKKIADDNLRIQYSSTECGPGYNAGDLEPVAEVRDMAATLKDLFNDRLGEYIEVMSVEVSTVRYGRRGRHFNNA